MTSPIHLMFLLAMCAAFLALVSVDASMAPTTLPGLGSSYSGKFFSGYMDIGSGKKLFYIFATSTSDSAESDPVVLWTNGGPGCSGMDGMFTELGPIRPNEDGSLSVNPFRWNTNANVIFIEQPAGVGFSEAPQGMIYGDDEAASDNLAFIKGFFSENPSYQSNKFYLASESYGGHYLPTLAKALVVDASVSNFKGFLVGNPLTYMPYRNYGEYATLSGHNMLPLPLWNKYVQNKCEETDSSTCDDIEEQMEDLMNNMNPYGLDFPICTDGDTNNAIHHQKLHAIYSLYQRAGAGGHVGGYFPESYQPCVDDWTNTYLNRADVQEALHIDGKVDWEVCNGVINANYNMTDVNANMMPVYQFLINGGYDLDIVIYSGDDDAVCATAGSQLAVWGLNLAGVKVLEPWAQWMTSDSQVGGYLTQFDGFSFITVHGAGHMVPATRPQQASELFNNFLAGKLTKNN